MKVTGSHALHAPRQQVWEALHDPRVLAATLPGCQQLEARGDGVYAATVHIGVASVTGTYTGEVALLDLDEPEAYTLKARGQGSPGTVDATARIHLDEVAPGQTEVSYDADAVVGGTIAGVGQRVLAGVAKRNAQAFFEAVDAHLTGAPAIEPASAGVAAGAGERPAPEAGEVFRAPPRPPAAGADPKWLLAAGVVGGLIALAGVLLGRRLAR